MKINDYVRIKKYGIRKIEMVIDEPDRKGIRFNDTDGWNKGVPEEEIIKSSPNIINLIEVGDYVNGYKVIDIVKGFKVIIDKLELDTTTGLYHNIGITNIKSVITREQMKSLEYKVKE